VKRTALKRKTPFRAKRPITRRALLTLTSKSPTAVIKENIQALLRSIAIHRDGGCIFRNYPEAGQCGGYRKDGELILQFDHLHSRANSISYGDPRLGVCACKRHHILWKKQYPDLYMKIGREQIGPERSTLLDRVQADRRPYRFTVYDWANTEAALRHEARTLGIEV